jgi:hypothetical protein
LLAGRRLELLADIPVLAANGAILSVARALVTEGAMPSKALTDAVHIAFATVYACDYLLTWNCRHIPNAEIQRAARGLVRRHGFELPAICTPEELMGMSMEWKDEIVEEVRATRNACAAQFDYDLDRIMADLKAKEALHPERIAQLRPVEPYLENARAD